MNNALKNPPEQENMASERRRKKSAWQGILKPVNLFEPEVVVTFLPYIFFLFLLAIIYIGNSYFAEKTVREVEKATQEIKELRSEFISGKSELMFLSKQSEVARNVASLGLKESLTSPKKISRPKQN
jgi:hypothetical protein